MSNVANLKAESTKKLPNGIHPGFDHLPPQLNVCRCKLWPVSEKQNERHADYSGLIWLVHGKVAARVFLWAHSDGTLGLRVQKLRRLPKKYRVPNPKPKVALLSDSAKVDRFAEAQAKIETLKNKKVSTIK